MLWTRCAILFAVGTLFSCETAWPQSPTAQNFVIGGTILEHGTNRPLKNAIVTVAPVAQQGSSLTYRTGEDGRFVFAQLTAGKYSLSATCRGFPQQSLAQNEQFSTAVTVGPGVDSGNVIFPLFAGATISGTVLDEDGEPVRQAQVWLFRKGVVSGVSRITRAQQQMTKSSGQFRSSYVKPGTYFIAVQAHPWYSQHAQPRGFVGAARSDLNGELDVSYPVTYYGDATDPASASALTVNEGSTSNVLITLRPVPSLHVPIVGVTPKANQGFFANLFALAMGGFQLPPYAGGNSSCSENLCEFSDIPPGRYQVFVNPEQGQSVMAAPQVVNLAPGTTIDLSSFRSNSLAGRITFEGLAAAPPQAMIALQPADSDQNQIISAAADGTLKLASGSLHSGRYQLHLLNSPGYYLKSVTAKGATVSAGELEIPDAASVQLSLVAAKGLTSTDGTAVKDGRPFAGAMVLLIPKDFTRTDFIRRDQSDSDGTFTLPDVPPGRYTLLAIDDGRELAYCEPEAVKRYLSGGKEITVPVSNGPALTVDVLKRQQGSN